MIKFHQGGYFWLGFSEGQVAAVWATLATAAGGGHCYTCCTLENFDPHVSNAMEKGPDFVLGACQLQLLAEFQLYR